MSIGKDYRRKRMLQRGKLKLSMKELAEEMGVHPSTVLRLESGATANPSGPMLRIWDQALHVLEADAAIEKQ